MKTEEGEQYKEAILQIRDEFVNSGKPFEIQRIAITGKNWDDIIALPCFRELQHYNEWVLKVYAQRIDGLYDPLLYYDDITDAKIGDTLVEYRVEGKQNKHVWGVIQSDEHLLKDYL